MAIEEEFVIEIPDSEADKIFSIADAVAYVSTHPMAKQMHVCKMRSWRLIVKHKREEGHEQGEEYYISRK